MSFTTAYKVDVLRNEFSDNLLSYKSTFNDPLTWNVTGGTGTVSNNVDHFFQGGYGLKIEALNDDLLEFNTATDLGCTVTQTGTYIFSNRVLYEGFLGDDPNFNINIFKNAVPLTTMQSFFTVDSNGDNWNCFAQTFTLNAGDVITFNFSYQSGYSVGSQIIWVDGLKLEFDDRNLGIPTAWSRPGSDCCDNLILVETQWDVTDVGPQVVANGGSLNLLTLINNVTHKNVTNSDTFDQLNIASNAIKTTYRNCKTIHLIRVSFNILAGTDQFYQIQIRRKIDDSVVYRCQIQRNTDETIQTIEMTTRTLSATDPFVIDGFYIAFVNNSGGSATIDDALSVLIISSFQKSQTP